MLQSFLQKIGIDRAVLFGLLAKFWSVVSGPVTALLIATQFTSELQGYYYTFGSILALQVFVEMGLGTVIIQFASHEWSKLSFDKDGHISGDREALSRLISLANIAFKWYLSGSVIVILGLGIGGYIFFNSHASTVNWTLSWLTLCLLTGLTISLVPVWSLLEGCNQVANVYTYRFWLGLLATISIWLAIISGAELWTASISTLVNLVGTGIFLGRNYRHFFKTLFFSKPDALRIEWRGEILPMQWRIALSWICGYFAFSLFTPVLFHYHGPVIAGQMGMTWSLLSALSSISKIWVSTKAPQFGIHIARREFKTLDKLFFSVFKVSTAVIISGACAAWIAIYVLNLLKHPFSLRLLPPLPVGIFLIATIAQITVTPLAIYLRSHRKEPLMGLSVIQGTLTGLTTIILGKLYSVTGVSLGYLGVILFLSPFTIMIWFRCRRDWHSGSTVLDL